MPNDDPQSRNGDCPGQRQPRELNYELRSIEQITRACQQLLGSTYDYDSVAADIWIEAWSAYGCTNTALVPVPYSQIKRRCIDARRDRGTRQKYEVYNPEEQTSDSEHDVSNTDDVRLVLQRSDLTLNETEVVKRKFLDNQTIDQIAEQLGTKPHVVARTLATAVEKLRSAMRSTGGSK